MNEFEKRGVFSDLLSVIPSSLIVLKRLTYCCPYSGIECTENMFYLVYKIIIFLLNKEKDVIRSANVYFNFFHETVNSHNLETVNHIVHFIFVRVLQGAMKTHLCRPIKTHVLSKLFYKVAYALMGT